MPPINNTWAQNAPEGQSETVTCPSGNTCEAKKLGMDGLIEAGILSDADSLTALVGEKHIRKVRGGKGPDHDEINMDSLLKEPKALASMFLLVDKSLPHIVTEPPVALHFRTEKDGSTVRLNSQEREQMRHLRGVDVLVFTDQIDLEDKMHLFEYGTGGLSALTSFRGGSSTDVGSVGPVASSKGPSKRRTRAK